ncbi:MAG: ATPase [Angelakisella sp.]
MATIDVLLNNLDEVVENSMSLPLSGGRCIVDAERIREIIDDIRLQMPNEIKQAKAVVSDRNEILSMAKREAEGLIRKAEERAKALVEQDTIVRQANSKALAMLNEANQKATDIMSQATAKANELTTQSTARATETLTQATMRSREMKKAAYEFSETSLKNAEDALSTSLNEVRSTRQALRTSAATQVQQPPQQMQTQQR